MDHISIIVKMLTTLKGNPLFLKVLYVCMCVTLYSVVMVICSIYRSVFTDIMDYIRPINELILSKDNVQVDHVMW